MSKYTVIFTLAVDAEIEIEAGSANAAASKLEHDAGFKALMDAIRYADDGVGDVSLHSRSVEVLDSSGAPIPEEDDGEEYDYDYDDDEVGDYWA